MFILIGSPAIIIVFMILIFLFLDCFTPNKNENDESSSNKQTIFSVTNSVDNKSTISSI